MSDSDAGTYGLPETYTYNKNGRLIKATSSGDYVAKYTWKNGRIVKAAYFAIVYDKNGWVTKTGFPEDIKKSSYAIKYDKYGYMISEGTKEETLGVYKNKYKDGRLVRSTSCGEDGNGPDDDSNAIIYKYKKIKVPASYVKQVKRQQDWLTNKGNIRELPLAAY